MICEEVPMTEQRKAELLEAAERAMAEWRALSKEQQLVELKRIGILDEDGQLSERYGGSGKMTWPQETEERSS
jgi:hypothetical protein